MIPKVIVFYLVISDSDIRKSKIYFKLYSYCPYEVGFINSYGHEIISIFRYDYKKKLFVGCNNMQELYSKFRYLIDEEKHIPLKTRLIDFLIRILERFKNG